MWLEGKGRMLLLKADRIGKRQRLEERVWL